MVLFIIKLYVGMNIWFFKSNTPLEYLLVKSLCFFLNELEWTAVE